MLEVELYEDINFTDLSLDDEEVRFHSVIGHVEDILMDEKFTHMLKQFMEKHWQQFDDSEENKFIYMDIFKEYIETIEKYLEEELLKRMSNFQMQQFEEDLKVRQNDLEGEIFEILSTFSDFCAFKSMILDYKNMKEGKTVDFSADLSVTKYILEDTE